MRRLPVMISAIVPLAAVAAESGNLESRINIEKLQQDVQASEILGAGVRGADGQEAGEVEDIVVGRNGRIEAVLVNTDTQMLGNDEDNSENRNAGAAEREQQGALQNASQDSGQQQAQIGQPTDEEGLRKVRWSQVSYDASTDQLDVQSSSGSSASGGSGSVQDTSASSGSSSDPSSGSSGSSGNQQITSFRVSELQGMEVHLEDAKSFGSVEDVLIDPKQGKATALLVDTWEGFDKQTYALPVNIEAINAENDSIDYQYTESDVVALQEFEDQ